MDRAIRCLAAGLVLLGLGSVYGCGGVRQQVGPEPAVSGRPGPRLQALAGTVVERMDASGYSYVCLEKEGSRIWAAMPLNQVQVGEMLNLRPGMVMNNFFSKTLNRSFDQIVFSDGPTTAEPH